MLLGNLMIDAVQSALQDGPDGLDRVRGGWPTGILAHRMVDRVVPVEQPVKVAENQMIIRVELRTGFNRTVNFPVDIVQCPKVNNLCSRPTTPFSHPEDGGFTDCSASGVELLTLVFVCFLAADKAFIDFDDSSELVLSIRRTASLPQALKHKPRGLLADADLLRELHRRDALARRHEQVHAVNPFMEGNVAPAKDGTSTHREIQLAGIAAVETVLPRRDPVGCFALGANRAMRPEASLQVGSGRRFIREHGENLEGGKRCVHASILLDSLEGVKLVIPQSIITSFHSL